ncbi:hypothetical protein [Streptomyces sp. NPDC096323]|uniref:DUF7426 family protein n=1 Tax=Streptomyces sp. NPDC096323 TaxID=3155822 RepID=UPI0033254303
MAFEALEDFLDDYLELPIAGADGETRTYRIDGPSALDGLQVERITTLAARLAAGGSAVDAPALDDGQELDLYRMCLGEAYEELLADLKWQAFRHVALTAMMWITADRETAEAYWNTGNMPGKAEPNRATRRQASRGSSASAAASTTRKPASTSGTRAASPRRAKAAAAAPH